MLIRLEKFFNSLVEAGLLCRHLDLTQTERVAAMLLLTRSTVAIRTLRWRPLGTTLVEFFLQRLKVIRNCLHLWASFLY